MLKTAYRWESKDLCQFYHGFFNPPPNTCFQKIILAKDSLSSNTCFFPQRQPHQPHWERLPIGSWTAQQPSPTISVQRMCKAHQSIIASKASKVRELQIVVGKLAQRKWSEKSKLRNMLFIMNAFKSMNTSPLSKLWVFWFFTYPSIWKHTLPRRGVMKIWTRNSLPRSGYTHYIPTIKVIYHKGTQ